MAFDGIFVATVRGIRTRYFRGTTIPRIEFISRTVIVDVLMFEERHRSRINHFSMITLLLAISLF